MSDPLRTILAHPFLALAREFHWDDRQLDAANKLIDLTVIRVEEYFSGQPNQSPPPQENEK